MKEILRIQNEYNLRQQINKLLKYILIQNKSIVLFNYEGKTYKSSYLTIFHFSHIKNKSFEYFSDIEQFKNFINSHDMNDYIVLMNVEYIEDNIKTYISVNETNLKNILGIDIDVILFEYHLRQFENDFFIREYNNLFEQILDENGIFEL